MMNPLFALRPPASPFVIKPSSASQQVNISLPFNFTPRQYQEEDLFRQMFPHHYPDLQIMGVQPKKRICMVWHRRAGKDKSLINAVTIAAYEEPANYLYLLPEQTQAKKIIWRGIDAQGFRFLNHIPAPIIKQTYNSEMLVELINGSTIQFGGSDNYDSWMGTNPKGIVFSEYSLQDPMAWQYFRPILVENGGWAVFNYTVRGKNHGYDLYQSALKNPEHWHVSLKSIQDTKREDGSPVVTHEQYLREIADGMPEAVARQEFYCDWEAALFGSYYGDLMSAASTEGRIGFFPHDPTKPVFTAWDLGLDATTVWFAQDSGSGCRLIDYHEDTNTAFTDTLKVVIEKPYTYDTHFGPHDLEKRDHVTLTTRKDVAASLGIDFVTTPRLSVAEGIEAVRALLPRCQFDATKADRGLECLRSYERVYDDRLQRFRDQPLHNWACHGADAFRILALNWSDHMTDDGWFDKKLKNDLSWVV